MDFDDTRIKAPPSATEIELSVLGVIIKFGDKYPIFKGSLNEDMFYTSLHRNIYLSINDLSRTDSPIDVFTVNERAKAMGFSNVTLGILGDMTDRVANVAVMEYNISVLKEMYVRRLMIRQSIELKDKSYDSYEEAFEAYSNLTREVTQAADNSDKRDSVDSLLEEIDEDIKNGITGESTGLKDLDDVIFGLEKGMIYTLAGNPGSGKTSLAITKIAKHLLEQGKHVKVASTEMPSKQIIAWLLMSEGVHIRTIKYGTFIHDDLEVYKRAVAKVKGYNITFTRSNNIDDILSDVSLACSKGEMDLLIIDYLQQLKNNIKNKSTSDEIEITLSDIKEFVKKHEIPVLILSQMTKGDTASEDKRPRMDFLRGSKAIEQASDVVLLLFRAEAYTDGECWYEKGEVNAKGLASLNIAKNKGGETKSIYIKYSYNLKVWEDDDGVHRKKQLANTEFGAESNVAGMTPLKSLPPVVQDELF